MANTMMRVKVHVQGDREFTTALGDGMKLFVGWRLPDDSVRLFYVPKLMLFGPISDDRFKHFKAQVLEEPIEHPENFINAIKANVSGAKTGKYWDGGQYANLVIDKLLGVPVEETAFDDSGDAVAQEETPKMENTVAETDDATPVETTKVEKKKREPKKQPPPLPVAEFKRGDRVYRKGDKEKNAGTITDPGLEQSGVKWDYLPNMAAGFETNAKLIKFPPEEAPAKPPKKVSAPKAPKVKEPKVKEPKVKEAKPKKAAKPAKEPKQSKKVPDGFLHWNVDENPRRPGTRAHDVVGKTMKGSKGGGLTLKAAFEKYGYSYIDYQWDHKRGAVALKSK